MTFVLTSFVLSSPARVITARNALLGGIESWMLGTGEEGRGEEGREGTGVGNC